MVRTAAAAAVLSASLALTAAAARADEPDREGSPDDLPAATPRAPESAAAGSFLPWTVTPIKGTQRGLASTVGGYDGARRSASFEATAEVRVIGGLALRGGGFYSSSSRRLRPVAGATFQALTQDRHGIDLAASVNYRAEGFNLVSAVETGVAVARRFGRVSLFGNARYGAGLSQSERYGDLRLAALHRLGRRVHLGIDSRFRVDLERDFPEPPGEAATELVAGPAVSFSLDQVVLSAYAGADRVSYRDPAMGTRQGAIGGVGVGGAF